jgi:enoyl-CoA hydratase/carnithine racemase
MSLLEIQEKDSVRVLVMNSGKDNRFNPDFVAALNEALDGIEADESARALVVTAAQEKYFSNGLDIEWIMKNGIDKMNEFFPTFLAILDRFLMFPKPVVAAINGHGFAGGFFLAMTADHRIMQTDKGWLCLNEIDLGMPLCKALLSLPTFVVGAKGAQRIVTTGERYTAPEAAAIGLVDQLTTKAELMDQAIEVAAGLGLKNPKFYAEFKRSLREPTSKIIQYDVENYKVPAP